MNKNQAVTLYIQNGQNRSKFKGCSPLKNRNGLISLKPAIAHFAYTCPLAASERNETATLKPDYKN